MIVSKSQSEVTLPEERGGRLTSCKHTASSPLITQILTCYGIVRFENEAYRARIVAARAAAGGAAIIQEAIVLSRKSEMPRISVAFDAGPVYPYIGVDGGSDHIGEVRMDPVQARFVQLLVVEILGAILCLGGLVLLFLGTSGKIGFFVKGPGIQARLTNGTPGLVIGLIGVLLIAFSLKGSVKRETSGQPVDVGAILSDCTEKAKALQKQRGPLTNAEMKDAILGTDPSRKIVSSSVQLKQPETLGQISRDTYGRADYWPLVGAINFDQGYFDFRTATAETQTPTGRFVEVWKVSRYYGQSEKTIIQLSGPAVAQANEELLQRAHSGSISEHPSTSG